MKHFITLLIILINITPYVNGQNRIQGVERLRDMQEKGIMFGHQDAPFYGVGWRMQPERCDVKELCGDYPAVMGFDIGGIEVGDKKNVDSIPFTRMREEILSHVERGGIVTLSWHPRNPLTGGTAWDVSDETTVSSVLPGGTQHYKFLVWMRRVRDFLQSLRGEYDRPVSIIIRPWHENNGGWFWWGEPHCSDEEFHALWCMLQDYFLVEGLENLIWCYSPNYSSRLTEEHFLERYPGDERVDIIGLDAYQWTLEEEEQYKTQLSSNLDVVCNYAEVHDKIVALTECGMQNVANAKWWTEVITPLIENYKISYFLVWRNAGRHAYYGPSQENADASDFLRMYEREDILFLEDILRKTE